MARTRTCNLCGATVKQNVAAHECPHGSPCRYLTNEDGMPVDWRSPECASCRVGETTSLRAVPRLGLTDKAITALDD
ncbi:MAG TPA: hypothetical protein ENK57_06990 [Polyangiaceae bacterium]|nr:hypothetical protein [Polyangiaceae bacterium]